MTREPTILELKSTADFKPPSSGSAPAGWWRGKLPDYDAMRSFLDLQEQFPELRGMPKDAQKRFIAQKGREYSRQQERLQKDSRAKRDRLDQLRLEEESLSAVIKWCENVALEKPAAPQFRTVRHAFAEGDYMVCPHGDASPALTKDFEAEIFRHAEAFVIEHDWAAAFEAPDMKEAPFKLPYEVCAFEFQFSGRSVVALAAQVETDVLFSPVIESAAGWILINHPYSVTGSSRPTKDPAFTDITNRIAGQIRAVCIALEAEVASSEVVREQHAGTQRRNSYAPLRSYHVVSLARRTARSLPVPGTPSGRRVRLHFRRGHWRHFEAHKTWIKWMLVGDPELGFIDKHYKL